MQRGSFGQEHRAYAKAPLGIRLNGIRSMRQNALNRFHTVLDERAQEARRWSVHVALSPPLTADVRQQLTPSCGPEGGSPLRSLRSERSQSPEGNANLMLDESPIRPMLSVFRCSFAVAESLYSAPEKVPLLVQRGLSHALSKDSPRGCRRNRSNGTNPYRYVRCRTHGGAVL